MYFAALIIYQEMLSLSEDRKLYRQDFLVLLTFCLITAVMLFTRYAGFYSFKGSDDLHYAFLSSKVLNGSYNMFFAQDIYAGRTLVVLYQALWFKIFGINDFTMCMPSLSVLIMLAYIVCFKCGLQKNVRTIIIAASLIYFNPVTTRTTFGNLPDVYIALIALLVFLLVKKNTANISAKQSLHQGIIAGLVLITGLFVKETIVLIYAGAAFVCFYYRKKIARSFVAALGVTVFSGIAAYLVFYYINTGNAFFHFVQIKNAAYFNPCSYGCFDNVYFLKRLTVTVPFLAIVSNAWPLLLVIPTLINYRQFKNPDNRFWKISFIIFLIIALYFPFSLSPYIPLCHDMRQFFFLFPFAAILFVAAFSNDEFYEKKIKAVNITGSIVFVLTTLLCLFFTAYNKWSILCNLLLAFVFLLSLFSKQQVQKVCLYLMLPLVLWLSTVYTVFKKPNEAYYDLKEVQNKIDQQSDHNSNNYYFLSNDTKTHFALINRFSTTKNFINLDTIQKGFKPFIAYQPQNVLNLADSIQHGWLIVSEPYLENLDEVQFKTVKEILSQQSYIYRINQTSAYWVNSISTIQKLLKIVNVNSPGNGCY